MKRLTNNKKYQSLYNATAILRVLGVLYKFPDKEFSLTELAKLANVAKPNLGKILGELHAVDYIELVKLNIIWRIKANQRSWYFIRDKIVYNLSIIYQSGIVEFLANYFGNPKIIVIFGSFRKGEDISNSDIDIAIETDRMNEDKYLLDRCKELKGYESLFDRKIQIHLFDRKNVDINLFNNIANGIVLFGFLEVNK